MIKSNRYLKISVLLVIAVLLTALAIIFRFTPPLLALTPTDYDVYIKLDDSTSYTLTENTIQQQTDGGDIFIDGIYSYIYYHDFNGPKYIYTVDWDITKLGTLNFEYLIDPDPWDDTEWTINDLQYFETGVGYSAYINIQLDKGVDGFETIYQITHLTFLDDDQMDDFSSDLFVHTQKYYGVRFVVVLTFNEVLMDETLEADDYDFSNPPLGPFNYSEFGIIYDGYEFGYNSAMGDYDDGFDDGYDRGMDDMFNNGSDTYGYNQSNSDDYGVGHADGITDSENLNMSIRDFVPGILGAIFGFFFTLAQWGVLGISILDILVLVVGVGLVMLVIRIILR